MARRRASMREGPLAELFRATEAAQKQAEKEGRPEPEPEATASSVEPPEQTVEHVPEWVEGAKPAPREPVRLPERKLEPKPEAKTKPEPKRDPEPPRIQSLPEPPPRLHRVPEPGAYIAVIRVVGVGGAGLNAVNRMIDADISQVEFVALNTDIQQLQTSDAPVKIHIGRELTEGLGSGADPDLGRRAAEEAYDQIKRALRGSDMVFVTAGEGGGTRRTGARRADRRHRHDAVQVRGHSQAPPGDGRRRGTACELRHGDRRPERASARGPRPRNVDARRVPDRRRRAAPGRAGDLRPDHAARPDQPRLRRRAHGHEGRGHGADGNRLLGERRGPREGGRRARPPLA